MDPTESNWYMENYYSFLEESAIGIEISDMNKLLSDQYSNFY